MGKTKNLECFNLIIIFACLQVDKGMDGYSKHYLKISIFHCRYHNKFPLNKINVSVIHDFKLAIIENNRKQSFLSSLASKPASVA